MRMLDASASSEPDVEVTRQDQDAINSFSRLHVRLEGVEEELGARRREREELDDAALELELADEEEPVMYKLDTSFIRMPASKVLELCEQSKGRLTERIEALQEEAEECERGMKELKTQLYGKFGKSINLERGDD